MSFLLSAPLLWLLLMPYIEILHLIVVFPLFWPHESGVLHLCVVQYSLGCGTVWPRPVLGGHQEEDHQRAEEEGGHEEPKYQHHLHHLLRPLKGTLQTRPDWIELCQKLECKTRRAEKDQKETRVVLTTEPSAGRGHWAECALCWPLLGTVSCWKWPAVLEGRDLEVRQAERFADTAVWPLFIQPPSTQTWLRQKWTGAAAVAYSSVTWSSVNWFNLKRLCVTASIILMSL